MRARGWSPSVRLFEAAACGTPIISDRWEGLDQLFTPDREIVLADDASDVIAALGRLNGEAIGAAGRDRVLAEHTARHRATALETDLIEAGRDRRRAA